MRSRLWAAASAAWTVAFIVLAYVRFHPQPWYVAIVAVAGLLALPAAILGSGGRGRTLLLFALAVLVVAALLGGWTAGPVLLPAALAAALAVKAAPVPAPRGSRRPGCRIVLQQTGPWGGSSSD